MKKLGDAPSLRESAIVALAKAPDGHWSCVGDPQDILELYEHGYVRLMKLGVWDRYVYQRTAAGRRLARSKGPAWDGAS